MRRVDGTDQKAKAGVDAVVRNLASVIREGLPTASFAEIERAALSLANQAVRLVVEDELKCIAEGFGDVLEYQGRRYRAHQLANGHYFSLCGPLTVPRSTYRLVGIHNGPTIVPLELEAGLIGRATPELARSLTHGYGEHDMRTHLDLLEKAHRRPPSRATMERMAKEIATDAVTRLPDIEAKVRRTEQVPASATGIAVGVDRTTTPMAEPSSTPRPLRKKPYFRSIPAPVEVNYRMAYVATVTIVNNEGEALAVTRYATGASDSEHDMMSRAMADVQLALRRRPDLCVGIVQDGAPEMWNLARSGLQKLKELGSLGIWHEAIDMCHLMERIANAYELIGLPDKRRKLEEWKRALATDNAAIDRLRARLRWHHSQMTDAEQASRLDEHLTYLDNNRDRMRYPTMRDQGLPVGSGVTESTCKTVVNQRAKGAGQRWSKPGLRGALHIRAVSASGRFDAFWSHFSQAHVADIRQAA